MANFTRAKPAGYGANSPIASAEIEQIDSNLAKAVNGDGGEYAGDLTWTGTHTFEADVAITDTATVTGVATVTGSGSITVTGGGSLTIEDDGAVTVENGAPVTVGSAGAVTRSYGAKNAAVAGNSAVTLLTLADWPALNSVGVLRCRLVSVVAVGASPHYAVEETTFTVRRLAAGIVSRRVEVTSDTSSTPNLEHDLSVADDSGDLDVIVTSSASSVAALSTLVVEAIDGPTFALA